MTQQQSQKLFDDYNRRYFSGRLPAYRILLSDQFGNGLHGLCRKRQREIHLGTRLSGNDLKSVLLHEMAHAAAPNGHGSQWLAEMSRLAQMGAPTRKDFEAYEDSRRTVGEKEITSHAFDVGMNSDWPWSIARGSIGHKYGLTDERGRSESKRAAQLMERCRKEFVKGRRCMTGSSIFP